MKMKIWAAIALPIMICVSCRQQVDTIASPGQIQEPVQSSVAQSFPISRGIIRSDNEIPVYSRIEGQLLNVSLLEGQKVSKGQILFRLEDMELKAAVELCEAELEQAQLKMDEILVEQGYKRAEISKVPEQIVKFAQIKSGVSLMEKELEIAKSKLSKSIITAPVSGVLTSLKADSYYFVEPGMTLCTIVDNNKLKVNFSVLETELRRFQVGDNITVCPISFPEESYTAIIRTTGSIVNGDGMVEIEAELKENGKLLPGMTALINGR